MRQGKFQVYLTDDHALLREGLKALLHEDPELQVAGESGSAAETLRDLAGREFDLLVLDLGLPDMDGFELLLRIRRKKPELPVLILTMYSDETLVTRLLKAGAAGYAIKENAPMQIVEAMRRIARGGRFLAPELAARMVDKFSSEYDEAPHERLSDREYVIFLKIAAGQAITRIAHELHISPSTVSTHRNHILEKLGLTNNAELVRYAMTRNLLFVPGGTPP